MICLFESLFKMSFYARIRQLCLSLFVVQSMAITAASAKTLYYDFDITGSDIHFTSVDVSTMDGTPRASEPTPAEHALAIQHHHILGSLAGQTGTVRLGFSADVGTDTGRLSCLSGILCGPVPGEFIYGFGPRLHSVALDPVDLSFRGALGGPWEWSLGLLEDGNGTLTFFDDGDIFGEDFSDGISGNLHFQRFGPGARFDLANVRITNPDIPIYPNPLPPGVILYGSALVPWLWYRRRTRGIFRA